jgi:hypothetical protein
MSHVDGTDDGVGYGVRGTSQVNDGVLGASQSGAGVRGTSKSDDGVVGVVGNPSLFSATQVSVGTVAGIGGVGKAPHPLQAGVLGVGYPTDSYGVVGQGPEAGVYGSGENVGVRGDDGSSGGQAASKPAGVYGTSADNFGVYGSSERSVGVYGSSGSNFGVYGSSKSSAGVQGASTNFDGVEGISGSPAHAGVSGTNTAPASVNVPSGFGVWAYSNCTGVFARGNPAAYFQGDVQVTGDVILVNSGSGDVSEDFDVEDGARVEPGTVVIINSNGKLGASFDPYDSRVAGVVSGAGGLKPAVLLQRIESSRNRFPIALIGKAFCKVDASFGSINAGDLLTTSPTPGHAMKVLDHTRATGAILGKALDGLKDGHGLIPILVSPR